MIAGRGLLLCALVVQLTPATAPAERGSSVRAERIFEALELREGMTVCEVGAGDGELTLAAARVIGTTGRVYTNELGRSRVRTLRRSVRRSGLPQITVVEAREDATNFPDQACDALFMRNVYHHFSDPPAMNAALRRALKPGARLAVVDFAPRGEEAERPADRAGGRAHGIAAATLKGELAAAGFEPVSEESGSGRWFMLVADNPAR